jgi:hypothetical protein
LLSPLTQETTVFDTRWGRALSCDSFATRTLLFDVLRIQLFFTFWINEGGGAGREKGYYLMTITGSYFDAAGPVAKCTLVIS